MGSDRQGNDSGEKEGTGTRQEAELPFGLASLSFPPVHIDSLLGLIWDFIKVVLRPALHFNLRILLAVLVHTGGCIQYVVYCLCISNQREYDSGPDFVLLSTYCLLFCKQYLFGSIYVQSNLISHDCMTHSEQDLTCVPIQCEIIRILKRCCVPK